MEKSYKGVGVGGGGVGRGTGQRSSLVTQGFLSAGNRVSPESLEQKQVSI